MSLFIGGRSALLPGGVSVVRRQVLWLSIGTFATLGVNWPRRLLARKSLHADGDLDWHSLIAQTAPQAQRLIESVNPAEEEYLSDLSVLTGRLNEIPEAQFGPTLRPGVSSSQCYDKFPLMVTQFLLAPGAAIPFHDHRDYNGVLCVADGQVRIRSFDIVGSDKRPPVGAVFLIRENRNELLGAGQLSTLSRTRDNIHDIRATGSGALLIDFFTFFSEHGKSAYLNVAQNDSDAQPAVLEASWSV